MTPAWLRRWVIAGVGAFFAFSSGVFALPNPFQVTSDLPVIANPQTSTAVLKDFAGSLSIEQVLARTQEFQPPAVMGHVDSHSHYWILQTFTSQLDTDREFRLDGQWLSIQTHVIEDSQAIAKLKTAGMSGGYSDLSNVDPALNRSIHAPSRSPLFTLKKGQTLTLLSKVKSYSTSPPKSFVLRLVDNARYLELRRFGLYIEGGLLGILFALTIFGWYSYLWNRDRASLLYAVWISFALFQVLGIQAHDEIGRAHV